MEGKEEDGKNDFKTKIHLDLPIKILVLSTTGVSLTFVQEYVCYILNIYIYIYFAMLSLARFIYFLL